MNRLKLKIEQLYKFIGNIRREKLKYMVVYSSRKEKGKKCNYREIMN